MTKNENYNEDELLNEGEEIVNESDLEGLEIIEEEPTIEMMEEEEIVVEMEEEILEEVIEEETYLQPVAVQEQNRPSAMKTEIEPLPAKYYDPSKSFKTNLEEFFTKNRKSKLKHIAAIVEKFEGREEEVMRYLYYKYVVKPISIINGQKPSFRSFLRSN